jgi:hypothetical protein
VAPICGRWVLLVDTASRSYNVSGVVAAFLDGIFESITGHVGEWLVAVVRSTLFVIAECDGLQGGMNEFWMIYSNTSPGTYIFFAFAVMEREIGSALANFSATENT